MSLLFYLGVWLNGRVAVSKTVGCGFESYHPCQNIQINLFFDKGGRKYALHTQQKLLFFVARTVTFAYLCKHTLTNLITL